MFFSCPPATATRPMFQHRAALAFVVSMALAAPSSAQYFDVEEQQRESDVKGYLDSQKESFAEDGVTELSSMATLVSERPTEIGDPWPGEDSLFERQYNYTMNSILTPFIPGEAVWSEPLGSGVSRESVRLGMPFRASNRRTRILGKAGPFGLDLYSLSALAAYSDLSGQRAERLPDDGFLAGIKAQAGLLLQMTDEAYLRVHATFYYLPTEGRGGFFFGNGGPSVASFRYQTQIKEWSLSFEDRLMVVHPIGELLDEIEVDELSVVGRRRFGRTEQSDFRPFSQDEVHFINMLRGTASKWIGSNLKLQLNADHWDMWRSMDFDHIREVDRLGAALYYDSPDLWFLPWASYDYYRLDRGATTAHVAMAGATLPFSRTLLAHVKGGWVNREFDSGRTTERPLWDFGIVHNITSAWSHSLYMGQDFIITDFAEDLIASYWRYSMRYGPRPGRWSVIGYVQQHQREADDRGEWDNTTFGGRFMAHFGRRTRFGLAGAFTTRDTDAVSTDITVIRASLGHDLTQSLTAELVFQYSDYDSSHNLQDLAERLLMLSLTWRL
ncbi:MAG: hypothetical protein JNJ83_05855 [Verrucomicrobiaceae bacterium]|nr:hypothetical protein [Verrucomicrobiaceae bacterium]